MLIETVNLHVWPKCNLKCVYCYGSFPDRPRSLALESWQRIIDQLAARGVQRVTFSGGEPTLHPDFLGMLRHARASGLQTSIITNGVRLNEEMIAHLDLVGITVDSAVEGTLERLGRGRHYLATAHRVAKQAADASVRLKINTVVCSLNVDEDLNSVVLELTPWKWKPIEFTFVPGEHDDADRVLAVRRDGFDAFVERHHDVRRAGIWVAPETAETVRKTYVMVDPEGRVFQHAAGGHARSLLILDVGFDRALASVGGYDRQAFLARGGAVDVRRLPMLSRGAR